LPDTPFPKEQKLLPSTSNNDLIKFIFGILMSIKNDKIDCFFLDRDIMKQKIRRAII
jgi:hypothetical protein